MAYPTIYALIISFMRYKGGIFSWAGLDNFAFLLSDKYFIKAILNTFIILIIQVPIMTLLAVIFANLLNLGSLKLKSLFRMVIFMPILIDAVSYSIVFGLFFNNDTGGLINGILSLVKIGPLPWLNDQWLAKLVIIIAVTWRWTGYNVVMILGGLQNISCDLYEAASIDGASTMKKFLNITIPGIRPVLTFSVVNSIIGVLQLFTEPNLITHSGPANETLTVVQYLYNTGFKQFNFGSASAGAYILGIMIAIITFIQLRVSKEEK